MNNFQDSVVRWPLDARMERRGGRGYNGAIQWIWFIQ